MWQVVDAQLGYYLRYLPDGESNGRRVQHLSLVRCFGGDSPAVFSAIHSRSQQTPSLWSLFAQFIRRMDCFWMGRGVGVGALGRTTANTGDCAKYAGAAKHATVGGVSFVLW